MSLRKLTKKEIEDHLTKVSGWSLKKNKLCKEFRFKDFKQAFSFMRSVAKIAEKMQHHPDWQNVYNKVNIFLSTHDIKGISSKDIDLVYAIEKLNNKN